MRGAPVGRGSTSDAGLLACREPEGRLGLPAVVPELVADKRRVPNTQRRLVAFLRAAPRERVQMQGGSRPSSSKQEVGYGMPGLGPTAGPL